MIGMFAYAVGAQPQGATVKQPTVRSCETVSRTRLGVGPVYYGVVRNEAYDFSAHIPPGLTGWGGVADLAPFHGFTIFLDSKGQGCIYFEVHLRVEESDAVAQPPKAKSFSLGEAEGWQTTSTGVINGLRLSNVVTAFSFRQSDEIDDGVIILVTPTSNARESLHIYEEFVRSVVFGH